MVREKAMVTTPGELTSVQVEKSRQSEDTVTLVIQKRDCRFVAPALREAAENAVYGTINQQSPLGRRIQADMRDRLAGYAENIEAVGREYAAEIARKHDRE